MRDYAKHTHRPVRKKNNANGTWILVLLALFTMCFIAYVVFHFAHEKQIKITKEPAMASPLPAQPEKIKTSSTTIPALKKTDKKATKPVTKKILNTVSGEPNYDFYKLLPETTVTVPKYPLKFNISSPNSK